MINRISLKNISTILFAVLVLIAILVSFGTVFLSEQIDDINYSWLSFKSQQAEKARLETALQAKLGYGGMIHDFKNYILRKEPEQQLNLQRSLDASRLIVDQYHALSSTQAEKIALDDIREMIKNYQRSFELTMKSISQGKSSREIDRLVRVDDTYALRGLKILYAEMLTEYPLLKDKSQKSVLATKLRTHMGYGGMIHNFKNYVLRNEEIYFDLTMKSISEAEEIIEQYRKLDPLLGELTALEDIKTVLYKYKKNLQLIKDYVTRDKTPEQIDQLIKIDDKLALRGLSMLDHDIIVHIDKESNNLSKNIIEITNLARGYMIFIITSFLLLALGLHRLFAAGIIHPVQKISSIMTNMAEGRLDFDHLPVNEKTELGAMFKALDIFKENELKRRQIEDEIRHMAMTDPLTGLANRNQLNLRFKNMTAMAKRDKRILALLLLDLDNFKPVNDNYGHAAGDAVLTTVSNALVAEFRETDLVARLGGDEFLVILYGPADINTIEQAAKRIMDLLDIPIPFNGNNLNIGVSIGITLYLTYEETLEQLLKQADNALYAAKDAGRNTYRIYNPEGIINSIQPQN